MSITVLLALARRIPWQAWLVAGVLAFAAVYHWQATNAAYEAGKAKTTQTINDANERAANAADTARQNHVSDCARNAAECLSDAWTRDRDN